MPYYCKWLDSPTHLLDGLEQGIWRYGLAESPTEVELYPHNLQNNFHDECAYVRRHNVKQKMKE